MSRLGLLGGRLARGSWFRPVEMTDEPKDRACRSGRPSLSLESTALDGLVSIQPLLEDAKCFDTVRRLHWPDGISCPWRGGNKETRYRYNHATPTSSCHH